jgi:hypothetical protein
MLAVMRTTDQGMGQNGCGNQAVQETTQAEPPMPDEKNDSSLVYF